MIQLLVAHLVAAVVAPALVGRFGRRAFIVLASAPAAAAVWALAHTSSVLDGLGPSVRVEWIASLGMDISFQLDVLSWVMVLMVGGVGAGVLIYCSRYFSERSSGMGRFAAVLAAFAGSMLGLVASADLIQLFIFWELTTVFSFLLIGHYSDRASSRRAALKAILVTTLGGLAMLVGILLLGTAAGTFDVREILASPPGGTVVTVGVVLLLVGALSKSALVPFHFWLPAAMAAPTPVSAYLHAAAMVKAGIYLVARFAPAYSTLPVWQAMVAVLGCTTLLLGGFLALRQTDLKLILAFGTVSQLGLLVILVGSPFQATALAGLALLIAHAMFKASLFLGVGIIDASTGTRDIRKLSGLGRDTPLLAVSLGLATASMIGLAPFAGYVAKEAALEAFLGNQDGSALNWILMVAVAVGSVLTVAYGLRFWFGAFGGKGSVAGDSGSERLPVLLIGPPALLALGGLAGAFFPAAAERVLRLHADTYPLGEPGHLTLWGGFTVGVMVTLAILVAGFLLFRAAHRVASWPIAWWRWDADLIYRHTLRRVDRVAAHVTAVFQRGSLPFYLGVILLVVLAGPGGALVARVGLPTEVRFGSAIEELAVGGLIISAAILAASTRRRLKAVILAGITGYGTALLFLLYGGPDLALTQVLVETVTLLAFVLVLRRLPVYFSGKPRRRTRWVRTGIAGAVGVMVGVLALVVPSFRVHDPVSDLMPAEAVEFGGGYNIVNVILVDVRAWDTMSELGVILAAATGIASLVFLVRRGGPRPTSGEIDEHALMVGRADPDPLASLRERHLAQRSETRRDFLAAASTLAPQRRSLVLEVVTRILYHTLPVFALFLLFSGHNLPGGGFAAGLIAGIALVVRYLAGGRYEFSAAARLQPGVVLGIGLFLAVGTGLVSMLFGGQALQSAIVEFSVPVFGEIKLVTALIFDVGVFLVVIGLMLDILRTLGAEIDRQGEVA